MNKEYLELIEKYLKNILSDEEKKKVAHLIDTDKNFEHLLNEEALISKGITYAMVKNTHRELQLLEDQLPVILSNSNRTVYTRNFYWGIAASLILISIAGYFLLKPASITGIELFTENFIPYPNEFYNATRGDNLPPNQFKAAAFTFYTHQQYQKSINSFDQILTTEDDPLVMFYRANALLAIKDFNEAINGFTAYRESGELFKEEATWYLALAYLGIDDFEKSKTLLQTLTTKNSNFAKDSNQLLKQLE